MDVVDEGYVRGPTKYCEAPSSLEECCIPKAYTRPKTDLEKKTDKRVIRRTLPWATLGIK